MSDLDLLVDGLAHCVSDPLKYVYWNYPWQEPGELVSYEGPQKWQVEVLEKLRDGVVNIQQAIQMAEGEEAATEPILIARTSGHGIGKSALVAWIISWAQDTMEDTKGIVTANTENQLKTKTWSELAKWHRLGMSSVMFKMTATSRFSIDPEHEKTWRVDMVPWSEKNTEAFAGLHNKGKRCLLIFDEASAIPDIIWETAEGALSDSNTEIIWTCFGNPTRSSGRFKECFEGGRFAHRWDGAAISSLDVEITNKSQLKKWIADYGEDHDFTRVRVLGRFPRVDSISFISLEEAREATLRPLPEKNDAPVVIGVDVARYGDDKSVIYPRRGLDARTLGVEVYQGLSTVQLATKVFHTYAKHNAVSIFVDGGGVGGGVIDQLLHMGVPVTEVTFGAKSDNASGEDNLIKYANKRSEIYGAMRNFIKRGCIPDELPGSVEPFSTELSNLTYSYVREDYIQLESKRDLKRRGLASPDCSDALACTFAYPTQGISIADMVSSGDNHYVDKYEYV